MAVTNADAGDDHLARRKKKSLLQARVFAAFVADTSAANSDPDVDVHAVFRRYR
jgi:hypothetical protein